MNQTSLNLTTPSQHTIESKQLLILQESARKLGVDYEQYDSDLKMQIFIDKER